MRWVMNMTDLMPTIAINDEYIKQRIDEHHDQLISSFLEIAVGQTVETARYFLLKTYWNIDKATNLFLSENDDDPRPHETRHAQARNAINQHHGQQISSFLQLAAGQTVDTAREFLKKTSWDVDKAIDLFVVSIHQVSRGVVSAPPSNDLASDPILSSLFRPPLDLLYDGSFEEAKSVSADENKWLLVNLQSRTEFASYTLNRDVWSNDTVSQAVESSFVLWQVYDHTNEGQEISSLYKIESALPVVLVIDPITGQKMRMWSGVIEAHSFLEDSMRFLESGPHGHIPSLTRNREARFEKEETFSSRNYAEFGVFVKVEEEETCSSSNDFDFILASSLVEESVEVEEEEEEETCLEEFPVLTEEPKGDCDGSSVCSLCVRFSDGRRKQRKFLKTEPIQLLWSFCKSQMEEFEKKAFKFRLVQVIPGASKTLEYGANLTFDESGLANSMVSVTREGKIPY